MKSMSKRLKVAITRCVCVHAHVCMKSWERRLDKAKWAEIRSTMEDFELDAVGDRESLYVLQ